VKATQVVELTGEAGEVAMLHPFLIHGFSANTGTKVRFACNPRYSLKQPMELDRADSAHSPVEEAIRRALGLQ
jgi:ectoine hydroxylase-related dioxygenase (phytanoyl-CoA dioxygenase family)